MISEENRRENILLQIRMVEGYIALWQTKIVSGAYKFDKATRFSGEEFSEEEKLKGAMVVLQSHTNRLYELIEAAMLPVEIPDPVAPRKWK